MRIFGRDITLQTIPWLLLLALLGAALLGAGATVATVEFNRHTSSDKFCGTSCHSMTSIPADPHYQQSAHVNNNAGVRPSCGQCHIPMNNFFVETYTHIKSGIRDVIAEMTTNFDDTKAWEARRIELAKGVRDTMRRQHNVTCRSCHTPASIKPASQTGQMIHAALPLDNPPACVDCHRNLVHSRPGPISSAEETKAIKRAADDSVHSSHLANLHLQKGMLCATCHGNDIILGSNPTAINTQCGACHGGIEQVAANFKGPANLNPHASQQGNTPCTTCHTGHQ